MKAKKKSAGKGIYDVIIIGGGPAGLTAANNTAHRGLKTLVIEAKKDCGGQPFSIFPYKTIRDHPGFPNGISGRELSGRLMLQAKTSGAVINTGEEVFGFSRLKNYFRVRSDKSDYRSRKIIISTGLLRHPIKHPVLEKYPASNVTHNLRKKNYRNKTVVIVGGGDSAFDNALQLSGIAKKVIVLVRERYAKAKSSTVKTAIGRGVIVKYGSKIISAVVSRKRLSSIKVHSGRKGSTIDVDEVIVCIGYRSVKDFLGLQGLKLNKDGSVRVDKSFETNIRGVFAAGDVDGEIKLIAIACAEGISAAVHAFEEIKKPYWLH